MQACSDEQAESNRVQESVLEDVDREEMFFLSVLMNPYS